MMYEIGMAAVYDGKGNRLEGVTELTTPVIKENNKDTTVLSIPYYYRYRKEIERKVQEMKDIVLKAVMQKQTDNLKELLGLIEKRPDLPVVAMVDSEIVTDDGGFWLGEWGRCEIDKYIVHEDYGVIFYEQGRPDTVDIFEKYFDYAECGIDEELPDEQALPLMKEKIDTLDWTEAIIVHIDLPETILREV